MRIALKYGLLITVGVIGWIVIAHWLVPNPQSAVHSIGALVFFNLVEIVGIYCGVNARKSASTDKLRFKDGVKTGVGIAFVYAVSSCLFFLIEILVVGTKMLKGEQGAVVKPMWQVAVGAFAGLFIFAIFLGLIYSTLVSFILVRQRKV
jgi:uncharacterized membrane protein